MVKKPYALRASLLVFCLLGLTAMGDRAPADDRKEQNTSTADMVFCTEMACSDGLVLEVPFDKQWAKGKYRFEFTLDSARVTCNASIPFRDCGDIVQCDSPDIVIHSNGCALETPAHGLGNVWIQRTAQTVDAKVSLNGKLLHQQRFTPHYTIVRPNGPQCEPVCEMATLKWDIP